MAVDYSSLEEDVDYFESLPADVWLMDDHKWAFFIWEQHRLKTGGARYSLMHADYHWDSNDDFRGESEAQAELAEADADGLRDMTAASEYVRYDSFIAPAVRRGLVSEVHFYCLQTDSEPLDADLCEEFGALQVSHPDVGSFAAVVATNPVIFDLCLDLFNRPGKENMDYGGTRWSDDEVLEFLEAVKHHIQAAELVTISLSFGHSGPESDTRHLAKLVVPRVLKWRQ